MARKTKTRGKGKESEHKSRAGWKGMLRFGLVAFPVQAFNARAREEERPEFHQLHATCHSRIGHEKVCPLHGRVPNDEIVLGYEYRKDEYVEIDPQELEQLRSEKERSLTIDAFVAPEEIDPIYFDGRMYYLAPDGLEAKEPYAVFLRALVEEKRCGIGQVLFSGRQQLVVVRPRDAALHMALLHYPAAIREPTAFVSGLPRLGASDKKVRLAEELIENWGDDTFDLSRYVDQYDTEIRKLIQAKAEGRTLVTPEVEEEPEVYNLMDALRKSVARRSSQKAEHKTGAPRGHSGNGRHRAHPPGRRAPRRSRAS